MTTRPRLPRVLLLASLLLPGAAGAVTTVDANHTDGLGPYRLEAPDGWQAGDRLILYSHGFSMTPPALAGAPSTAPSAALRADWLDQSYALAAAGYSTRGWALFDVGRVQIATLDAFAARFGAPGEVVLIGGSLGGLVSLRTAEVLHAAGRPANGVLAACAPAGGSRTWDQAVDLRLIFDAICPRPLTDPEDSVVPWLIDEADIPLSIGNIDDPNTLLQTASVANRVRECTGLYQPSILDTPAQLARRQQLKALARIGDDDFLKVQIGYAVYPLADLVQDADKLSGVVGFDNTGIDYGDDALNMSIRRVTADRVAAVKLAASSDLTGNWGDTRVLAIHGSRDELVFPEHLAEIAALQRPDARAPVTAVVRENEAAHCGFTDREVGLALTALRDWIDVGQTPTAAGLQSACAMPDGSGERCAFDASIVPAALSSRVRERDSLPDVASTNHAGIWYDPAFSGEGWVIEVLPDGETAVVSGYTYPETGAVGDQDWLIGLGRLRGDGIHVADLHRYRGARFDAFDSADIEDERWGEVTLAFNRCGGGEGPNGVGTLGYEGPPTHGGARRDLVQLTALGATPTHCLQFIVPPTPHPESRHAGSWYRGPQASGDGIQFQVTPEGLGVMLWYTFDPQGHPAWLLGLAEQAEASGLWRFELLRPRGTRFGDGFDPDDVVEAVWGQAELRFTDCDHLSFTWQATEAGWPSGQLALQRLTAPAGIATCLAPSTGLQ